MPIESFTLTGSGARIHHPGDKLSPENITQFLEQASKKIEEYNVAVDNRYLVVPRWAIHWLNGMNTHRGQMSLIREQAVRLKLRGGARKAYVRSRRNNYWQRWVSP